MPSALETSSRPDGRVRTSLPGGVPGPRHPTRPVAATAARTAKTLLVVCDALVVAVAMALAAALGHGTTSALAVGLLSLPLWLIAFARTHLYVARAVSTRRAELTRLARGVGYGVVAMAALAVAADLRAERGWLAASGALSLVLLALEREVVRHVFAYRRGTGRHLRPVVVVGTNGEGRALGSMFLTAPKLGYRVVGYVDAASADVVRTTVALVEKSGATGVIVAPTGVVLDDVNTLARTLCDLGVHVEVSSSLRDIAAARVSVRQVGGFPMLHVEPARRGGWRAAAKRALDVVVATTALIATLPLLALAALAIKLDSRGPVLFRQRRLGRAHEPFDLLKLRTMVVNADELKSRLHNETGGPLFKIKADPRVTRVGRILRKFSIDELPQLWNVLRGEMSLVGPRPALPDEMRHWPSELHRRLHVKPGITGLWQVNGRSDGSFSEYIRWDLYYVDNWSLGVDVTILARTLPVVLSGNGAY